jgi:acetoin utilization protein AcuB
MLTVRDVMTTDVVTLTPEATLRDAMEALSTNHLSGVPVVVGERVVGVISMSDILSFIVEDTSTNVARMFDRHTVADLMTYEVFSVAPAISIRSAADVMRKRGIHRVLVMDEGRLAGIVSALDIARVVSESGVGGRTGIKPDPCRDDQSNWITV